MSGFTGREKVIMLAACQGTLDALLTDKHLGDVASARNLESRTLRCDAFETAFEWARREKAYYQEAEKRIEGMVEHDVSADEV